MVEKGEIISDESKVANSFSCFFERGINLLGIKTKERSNQNFGLNNPVKIAIKKFEQDPGINLINEDITNNESFHFLSTEQESIILEIINLDNKKPKLLKKFLLAVSRMQQISVALL